MFFCTCPSQCPQIFRNHSTTMASLTPLAPTARSIVGEEEVGIHILQCLALRHCFSAIGPFSWSFFHPVCCSTQISPRKANLEPTRVATCANQMNVQIIEPHITLLPCCLMCFFGGLLEEKKNSCLLHGICEATRLAEGRLWHLGGAHCGGTASPFRGSYW